MEHIDQNSKLLPETGEFFFDTDDCQVHMKLTIPEGAKGQLPMLLILHGYTGDMEEEHLRGFADSALSLGMAALRIELYGHGMSSGEFCDHTLDRWLNELLSVIDYVKALDWVDQLFLTGHSQGGLLSVMAAARRAEKIDALLPMAPALSIPDMARYGNFLGTVFDPNDVPEVLDVKEGRILRRTYIDSARKADPYGDCSCFKGPVLLVHGTADTTIDIAESRKAEKLFPDARLVEIDGDVHCFDYHLDQVLAAMRDFLAGQLQKGI